MKYILCGVEFSTRSSLTKVKHYTFDEILIWVWLQGGVKYKSIVRPHIRCSDAARRNKNSDFTPRLRARENKPLASTIRMLILSCKRIFLSSFLFLH